MGASNGADTLYHLKDLTRADIAAIIRGLYGDMKELPGCNMSMPTIDGDSNNICLTIARKSGTKSASVASFFNDWAHCGIKVVPVVDGDVRPVCKQATIERKGKREMVRIEGFTDIRDANKIKSDIARGLVPSNQLEEKNKMLSKLEKSGHNKLSASEDLMPMDFAEALEDMLVNDINARIPNDSGGFVASVLKAKFQADAVIIQRYLNMEIVMAITRDSDMPIIAGDGFLAVKEYTKSENMTIVCTCKATLERAMKYLPEESKDKVQLVDAKCPIFEGVKSRQLRALMMVAMGCDVYKPGIVGVGPVTLKKQMDKVKKGMSENDRQDEDKFFNELLKHVAQKTHLAINVIETFVKGIIYEPTNAISCDTAGDDLESITKDDYTYYDGVPPNSLPEYLSDLASSTTSLDEGGPAVSWCKGVGGTPHMFLPATGCNKCHGCNATVCGFCSGVVNDKPFCLQCKAAEMLIPSKEGGYMDKIANMRKELKEKFRFDGADELPLDEVEEVYEAASAEFGYHKELTSRVKFPLYSTDEFNNPTKWKEIATIQFSEGGSFITDPALKSHVPGLLKLFSSFVDYEKKKYTSWVKDPAVYEALPKMIIGFAQNSRVDSGYRLMERCVRHGHDPKMHSMFYNSAKIIQLEDDSLGLKIEAKVPASMKEKVYNTGIAHTATDILAVKCSCKAGSQHQEGIICVHTPVIPYKVTELLLEDMAEHLLLELASCLASVSEDWSAETTSEVKGYVVLLMEAAGETVGDEDKNSMTLEALLDRFLTGTEKTKTWGARKRSAKASQQGPITELCFKSPAKLAKELKNKNKKERQERNATDTDTANNTTEHVPMDIDDDDDDADPNYIQSTLLMDAAGIRISELIPVGFRVANLRANKQMSSVEVGGMMQLRNKMADDWKKLQSEAEERSIRQSPNQRKNLSKKRPANDEEDGDTTTPPTKKSKTSPTPLRKPGWKLPTQEHLQHWTKIHSRCSRLGCNVTNVSHPNTSFHRIKKEPKPLSTKASKQQYIEREGKVLLRKEILDRCHFKRNTKGGAYRVCEEHEFEWVVKPVTLTWFDKRKNKEVSWTQSYNLYVPKPDGSKHVSCMTTKKPSFGGPAARQARKSIETLNDQIGMRRKAIVTTDDVDVYLQSQEADVAAATADAAESRLAIQQMAEVQSPESELDIKLNPSVAEAAGLPYDTRESPPVKTPNTTFFNSQPRISTKAKTELKPRRFAVNKPPTVRLGMDDKVVKSLTGFPSESMLLAYIIVVCGGRIDLISQRCTSLTWYEEWFFHFEWKWRRSLTRWEDAEKKYDVIPKYLRCIHRRKLALEKRCFRLWPTFLSYDEDVALRKPKWNLKYREKNGKKCRVIMWDMTGIKAYAFGAADTQRNTWSKYYAGNCFKGAVGIDLAGYIIVYPLWGGHVSDTDYNKKAGYLEDQAAFQNQDLVDNKVVRFTNIYDKGYRARAACWRHDKQLIAQPVFGKSDQRFKGEDTLYSASLASDRGGNERGVNVSKRSGVIKKGFGVGMDAQIFQDNWITWGFQCNFMFKPVL